MKHTRESIVALVSECRARNRGIIDMRGIDLSELDLQGVDLQWVDLQEANLSWTNLQGADLQQANLQDANLQGATLQVATSAILNHRCARAKLAIRICLAILILSSLAEFPAKWKY